MLARGKTMARQALVRALYQRTASNRAKKRHDSRDIKRILVIRPDHLGDLLFATPTLDLIRQVFPQAHITGAVGPWGKAMWADNPNLDGLDIIPFPGITSRGGLASYTLLGETARRLAGERYDFGIALRFDHWWGAALLWAAGVPRRWGYDTPGMCAWLTNPVQYTPGKHEVEQDLRVVEAVVEAECGVPLQPPHIDRSTGQPPLRPPNPSAPPEGLFDDWLGAPRRAMIHPGTAAANKLWTIQGWAEVIRKLASEGWSVALTGSPDERALGGAIMAVSADAGSRLYNFAGRTANVSQLTWMLDRADMVLGVDNGPLHIADALGKQTLHLYGPSDETIWGPWGDPRTHRAFRAPGTHPTMRLDTLSSALEGGSEMRAITPDMVMEQIRKLQNEQ